MEDETSSRGEEWNTEWFNIGEQNLFGSESRSSCTNRIRTEIEVDIWLSDEQGQLEGDDGQWASETG